MTNSFKLTKDNFPTLLTAFEIVANAVDVSGPFMVPRRLLRELPAMEGALSTLSPDDLETFCIGEQTDQEILLKRNPTLAEVSSLIDAHFGF